MNIEGVNTHTYCILNKYWFCHSVVRQHIRKNDIEPSKFDEIQCMQLENSDFEADSGRTQAFNLQKNVFFQNICLQIKLK